MGSTYSIVFVAYETMYPPTAEQNYLLDLLSAKETVSPYDFNAAPAMTVAEGLEGIPVKAVYF